MPDRVDIRSRSRKFGRGGAAISILVVLGPVILVLSGLAVDLGRLYFIKSELKTAANAAALAAAQRLIGTDASSGNATASAQLGIANTGGLGNKYDFAGLVIGGGATSLASSLEDPEFFDTASGAIGGANSSGNTATGAQARYARITVRAEAPLLFFGLIPLGQERKTPILMEAVAGMSAPLCVACGIENIAIAPLDDTDTTDFGYVPGSRYTLGYQCLGAPVPQALPNTQQRVQYLLLDRYDTTATVLADEQSQMYRIGAGGLIPSTNRGTSCFTIGATELLWASATVQGCATNNVATSVRSFACGIGSRFDTVPVGNCANIAEIDALQTLQPVDTDLTELDDYAAYTGNTRRIITVPIVDVLSTNSAMTLLAFRQFLIQPNQNTISTNTTDPTARFAAIYLGSVAPIRQGRYEGCQISTGPGKVVLHR